MYKRILFIFVLISVVWCDLIDNTVAPGTVKTEECMLAKQLEELKTAVLKIQTQLSTNLTETYEIIELPIREDISFLKTSVQKQHKVIASLKDTIMKQEQGISELKQLFVEGYGNLSRIVEGIETKTAAESQSYDPANVFTEASDSLKEYPFLALLGYGTSLDNVEWRGDVGIILNNKYLLVTGWRATEPYNGGLKYVALGVKNRTGSRKTWQVHQVTRKVVHPGYRRFGYADDVAVVETLKPMLFNDRVQAACLPSNDSYEAEATLTTWWHSYSRISVDFVRSVSVQRYSQRECVEKYHEYNQTTQLCYGHKEDPRASCDTWSSDPLVVKGDACSKVIGIRWAGTCSQPDVFTMLYHYLPWINNIISP